MTAKGGCLPGSVHDHLPHALQQITYSDHPLRILRLFMFVHVLDRVGLPRHTPAARTSQCQDHPSKHAQPRQQVPVFPLRRCYCATYRQSTLRYMPPGDVQKSSGLGLFLGLPQMRILQHCESRRRPPHRRNSSSAQVTKRWLFVASSKRKRYAACFFMRAISELQSGTNIEVRAVRSGLTEGKSP